MLEIRPLDFNYDDVGEVVGDDVRLGLAQGRAALGIAQLHQPVFD